MALSNLLTFRFLLLTWELWRVNIPDKHISYFAILWAKFFLASLRLKALSFLILGTEIVSVSSSFFTTGFTGFSLVVSSSSWSACFLTISLIGSWPVPYRMNAVVCVLKKLLCTDWWVKKLPSYFRCCFLRKATFWLPALQIDSNRSFVPFLSSGMCTLGSFKNFFSDESSSFVIRSW